jgi:hypothetical protein
MKVWKDTGSPWGAKAYFADDEFDVMMDELRSRVGPECFAEGRGIDIDLILLRCFAVEADYLDLPPNTLGRTLFAPDGRVQVQVSRDLAELAEADKTARHRLRTTLAHECGHISCHRQFFLRDCETLSLFIDHEPTQPEPAILCRNESVGRHGYKGEWWEFQANQCMAALLLPKELVVPRVAAALASCGQESFKNAILEDRVKSVLLELSNQFDVSLEATFYRLQDFGYIPTETQAPLEFSDPT